MMLKQVRFTTLQLVICFLIDLTCSLIRLYGFDQLDTINCQGLNAFKHGILFVSKFRIQNKCHDIYILLRVFQSVIRILPHQTRLRIT